MDDNVINIEEFIDKSDKYYENAVRKKEQELLIFKQRIHEHCAVLLDDVTMKLILNNALEKDELDKIAKRFDVSVDELKEIAFIRQQMLKNGSLNKSSLGIGEDVKRTSSRTSSTKGVSGDESKSGGQVNSDLSNEDIDHIDNNLNSGDEKSNGDDLGEEEHTKSVSNDNGSSGGGASDSEEKKEDEKAKTEQVLEPEGEKKPNSIKEADKKLKAALDSSQATVGVGILVAMGVVYLAVTNPALVGAVLLAKGVKDYRSGAKGK